MKFTKEDTTTKKRILIIMTGGVRGHTQNRPIGGARAWKEIGKRAPHTIHHTLLFAGKRRHSEGCGRK